MVHNRFVIYDKLESKNYILEVFDLDRTGLRMMWRGLSGLIPSPVTNVLVVQVDFKLRIQLLPPIILSNKTYFTHVSNSTFYNVIPLLSFSQKIEYNNWFTYYIFSTNFLRQKT